MSTETDGSNPGELSPQQKIVLEGFVGHYVDISNAEPRFTAYYDQASAHVRDALKDFGISLETPQDYYPIMAGLSIGTVWIEGLVAHGLTVSEAAEVLRTSLARLFPKEPS